jgi:hypothetical protein
MAAAVFLSYSRIDRALAQQVVDGLRAIGVDVWWDVDMPGVNWQDHLARLIHEIPVVLVLWTPASVNSKNVGDEARLGQRHEKLVNALAGVSLPPFPFDRTNGLPLDGWNGRAPHHGWARLVQTIDDRLAEAGLIEPGRLLGALRRREQAIRDQEAAFEAAQEAYADAKAEEDRTSSALAAASASFKSADDEFPRIVQLQPSKGIIHAAEMQLDAAVAERDAAKKASDEAAKRLVGASRSLTRAKADLERLFDATTSPAAAPAPQPPPAPLPPPAPIPPQSRAPPRSKAPSDLEPKLLLGLAIALPVIVTVLFNGPLRSHQPEVPVPSPLLGLTFAPKTQLRMVADDVAPGGSRGEPAFAVASVTPGGPADQAGLQINDDVIRINGMAVTSLDRKLVTDAQPGQRLQVTFVRGLEQAPQSVVILILTKPKPAN